VETLLHFIRNSSGANFLVLCLFLFVGVFVNQVSGRGDWKYLLLLLGTGLILGVKIATTDSVSDRYHLHIMEYLALPLSFSLIHFFRFIRFDRRAIDVVTYLVIFFQLVNITRFSLLSKILPAYQTTFSLFAALTGFYGLLLLFHGLFRNRAMIIVLISMFCAGISFAKWLLPLVLIYLASITWYLLKRRSLFHNTLFILPVLLVLAVSGWQLRNSFAAINGYNSFDDYVSLRITKDTQQSQIQGDEVFNQVGGLGDGGRLFIWGYHVNGWLDGNILTGVSLSFTNPFHYPEHNVFVFYVTRFGVLSFFTGCFVFAYYKNRSDRFSIIRLPYWGLLFFIFILFSVGGWYGVPLACLALSVLIGLFQNQSISRIEN
jgi:hypothetical protein